MKVTSRAARRKRKVLYIAVDITDLRPKGASPDENRSKSPPSQPCAESGDASLQPRTPVAVRTMPVLNSQSPSSPSLKEQDISPTSAGPGLSLGTPRLIAGTSPTGTEPDTSPTGAGAGAGPTPRTPGVRRKLGRGRGGALQGGPARLERGFAALQGGPVAARPRRLDAVAGSAEPQRGSGAGPGADASV